MYLFTRVRVRSEFSAPRLPASAAASARHCRLTIFHFQQTNINWNETEFTAALNSLFWLLLTHSLTGSCQRCLSSTSRFEQFGSVPNFSLAHFLLFLLPVVPMNAGFFPFCPVSSFNLTFTWAQ